MSFEKCVFKYQDIENDYFIANLKNNELIIKHYKDFNDPYESHFGVSAIWPSPYKEETKFTELIQCIEPDKHQKITKSKSAISKYIRSNTHLLAYTISKVVGNLKRFKICSFTRRWNQILMWVHYANRYRGVALVFDQEKI